MHKGDGLIRIGTSAIDAVWRRGRLATPVRILERIAPTPIHGYLAFDAALGRVLSSAPHRRLFFSPHLRIMLADPLLQMAVIRFNQLPRSRSDVELLVTQRFCRDHRAKPADIRIACSLQPDGQGERSVLVCAQNARLADAIQKSLAERKLHADIIAAESMFAIRALQSALSPAPSLLLLLHRDYATIILWTKPTVISHIGVFQQHDRTRAQFLSALKTRIERYAATVHADTDRLTIDLLTSTESGEEANVFGELPNQIRNLRHDPKTALHWSANTAMWEAIAEIGG